MPDRIGFLLGRMCRLMRKRLHSLLEDTGLHRGQHFILHVLWEEEGIMHSELAARSCVQPATITNALKRMEKAGLVERRRDTEDERVSRVYLTEAGRDMRSKVEDTFRNFEAQAFAGLSEEEVATLRALLLRVQNNLVGREE
ncbi:MAG: MarR family transcriptional regulator [Anaerolineae bacterium]